MFVSSTLHIVSNAGGLDGNRYRINPFRRLIKSIRKARNIQSLICLFKLVRACLDIIAAMPATFTLLLLTSNFCFLFKRIFFLLLLMSSFSHRHRLHLQFIKTSVREAKLTGCEVLCLGVQKASTNTMQLFAH